MTWRTLYQPIDADTIGGVTNSNYATLDGLETLTTKTFTSPDINAATITNPTITSVWYTDAIIRNSIGVIDNNDITTGVLTLPGNYNIYHSTATEAITSIATKEVGMEFTIYLTNAQSWSDTSITFPEPFQTGTETLPAGTIIKLYEKTAGNWIVLAINFRDYINNVKPGVGKKSLYAYDKDYIHVEVSHLILKHKTKNKVIHKPGGSYTLAASSLAPGESWATDWFYIYIGLNTSGAVTTRLVSSKFSIPTDLDYYLLIGAVYNKKSNAADFERFIQQDNIVRYQTPRIAAVQWYPDAAYDDWDSINLSAYIPIDSYTSIFMGWAPVNSETYCGGYSQSPTQDEGTALVQTRRGIGSTTTFGGIFSSINQFQELEIKRVDNTAPQTIYKRNYSPGTTHSINTTHYVMGFEFSPYDLT